LQAEIIQEYTFPLAGDFVQNRVSMINWCPIGRASGREARKAFKITDQNSNIRAKYINKLEDIIKDEKIGATVKLGGDTSFDIFPTGWDKTYALNHFDENSWRFWFVGDRCYPQGNDYEIFSFLKDTGCAYETSGPEETLEIIDFHILRELQ
jgi:phosphomannomutase